MWVDEVRIWKDKKKSKGEKVDLNVNVIHPKIHSCWDFNSEKNVILFGKY